MISTYRRESIDPDVWVSALSESQMARMEALKASREFLASRNISGAGPVDALDLVNVALYIETGCDPWKALE